MGARVRFVIVSCPRTGSTHLVDYLGAVPGVCCLSEVFRSEGVLLRQSRAIDPRLLDMKFRAVDPLGWLEQLEAQFDDCGWFGFKLFPNQQKTLLHHLCAAPDWKKIYLWRDNLLEQYVSSLLAMKHFAASEWGRVPDDHRLVLRPDLVVPDLATIESDYIAIERALANANLQDVFALEYGALSRPEVMKQLLEFLGLPASLAHEAEASAAPQGQRVAPRFARGPGAAARIENYDEISRILKKTRYGRFLQP